ncbi:efflux RND transporter periplasmic adaptor subunit [Geoalkalibacter sp.]|uniref:efflux RND transporter periplasmic adaptor subunit n=1 Tax=Geoalkalibacter sp. TaxID=3041440 RepID=UPI00272EDA7A|nr:efflux RND transporter periplasmic adaptor subunit [Geoalkalibacter sp.]
MTKRNNSFLALLVLGIALTVGLGFYILSGPPSPAHAQSSGHADHDHRKKVQSAAAEDHDDHDEDEDLEDLFGDGAVARSAGEPAKKKDSHAGHDHGRKSAAAGHEGHDHDPDEICPEHDVPEIEDALCSADLVGLLNPGEGMKVRLGSREVADRVGIQTAVPMVADEAGVRWPAQVVFNRDRMARLSAVASGSVRKVHAGLGERVKKGQILVEIAAPETGGLASELAGAESRRALAEAVFLREKDLLEKGVTSRQEYQQAESELRQAESSVARARRQLQDYGLDGAGAGSNLPIRAPFDGTIVERSAVVGEAVNAGDPLVVIADLDTLWLEISLPEDAVFSVRDGMSLQASFTGLPGRGFAARLFWIAPALDEKTRMIRALAEVDNRAGLLRGGLFGQVQPVAEGADRVLSVPVAALQSLDGQPFLFLRLEDDLFELRRVVAGRRDQGAVIIREGLDAADRVVTAQAFSLKSEVLRARLGASCADH